MGVSLSQWRVSIGSFNVISVRRRFPRHRNQLFSNDYISQILHSLAMSLALKIFFGVFLILAYCFMVIFLLPLCLILYPFNKFSCDISTSAPGQFSILRFLPSEMFSDGGERRSEQCPGPHDYPVITYFAFLISIISALRYRIRVVIRNTPSLLKGHLSDNVVNTSFMILVVVLLLLISGTVEINPGPPNPKLKNLSFAVWNLDSLPARDFARIPLIETLQCTYDFDLFGICESMLSEKISNEQILINGFSPDPLRADKAANIRNGGVCLYFKEYLPIKQRHDLEKIPETIVAEIKLNKKKIFFVLSYRHPNMTNEEVVAYMNSMNKIYESISKENPYVSILCGDFNARSPIFWEGDSENSEGRLLNDLLISSSLEQLISEPTHVRDDGSQSCIDLICTNQPFMLAETGVLPSLDSHSKHNIIHGTMSINMPRPPSYKRKIWDYKTAKIYRIRADLLNVNWRELFFNLNVSEMVLLFTDVFFDTISRHISYKVVTFNNKDAPWITPRLKTAIKRNSRVYRKWVNRGRNPLDHDHVRKVQNDTNKLIKKAKLEYFSHLGSKLSDPKTGQKQFWTSYKKIANKKLNTNISPIVKDGEMECIFLILMKKLESLTISLLINVLLTIMAVSYRGLLH